jgi:predicted CopG family antitoxin
MTSKTISVSEDVYNLLKKMKLKGESFSVTIRRLVKGRWLSDCAGLWSDLPDDALEEIKAGVLEAKRLAVNSLEAAEIESH